jgi:acyl carrier protein
MSRSEAELREIIFASLRRIAPDTEPSSLAVTDKIRDTLEIDSYDFLQFLISLNKQLGIDVPEADYGKLQTIHQLTAYLQERGA